MTLDDYQRQALTTDIMKRTVNMKAHDPAFVSKILGLAGESGEVAEKFKKIVRDQGGEITKENKIELRNELGDVLWYISIIADYLGLSLDDVANNNLNKLFSRRDRDEIKGSGDNR